VRIETTTICGTDLHIPKGDVPAVQPGRILGHEGVLEGVTPEAGTLLSDILPTGHEIGVQYGAVKPGDVVAVVGAGPVGLAAITTAGLYGPARIIAIDVGRNRVEQAKQFGATDSVVSTDDDWKDQVMALTGGLGVDVAIEAVGVPETFAMVLEIVRPAGHVAKAGVHGRSVRTQPL
jgi:alcohol dehydrogenase